MTLKESGRMENSSVRKIYKIQQKKKYVKCEKSGKSRESFKFCVN